MFVCHDGLFLLQMRRIASALQCSLKVGVAVRCSVCVAECCSVCVVVCCSVLRHVHLSRQPVLAADATHCKRVAVFLGGWCCSMCVAVCCSVCVAVCCSVLRRFHMPLELDATHCKRVAVYLEGVLRCSLKVCCSVLQASVFDIVDKCCDVFILL